MKIGVAGLGRMGAAIARRLLDVGHEVVVWNRSLDKCQPLEAAGAKVGRRHRHAPGSNCGTSIDTLCA